LLENLTQRIERRNLLSELAKSPAARDGHEADHGPKWSMIGGVVTMVCNAATIPVLYFVLDKGTFAEWATALACLNLWCFPESARNLLITSGYHDVGRNQGVLTCKFVAVAGVCALATLLLHVLGLPRNGSITEMMELLAPLLILALAIPLRFRVAEFRGRLQASGKWRLHALLTSGLNLLLSVCVIATAYLTRNVKAIAAAYALVLFVQARIYAWMAGGEPPPVAEFKGPAGTTSFAGAMALALGPLLFSQGDKIGLRFVLSEAQLAEYAFYVAIAGQINVVGALPCIPLAAWFRQAPEKRDRLLRMAQYWNIILVVISMLGVLAGFFLIKALFPDVAYSKLSGALLFCAVSIYGLLSLNAPAYFLLIGQGEYRLVGWGNLLIAGLSLGAILLLGSIYGIYGAVMGNIIFGFTVLWGILAHRRTGGEKTGWLLGGFAALCMMLLSFLSLYISR
jgi:O-antigen/teichoic acid export membrane protein